MTKEEALALFETKWWEGKTHREIAEFQIGERLLCCPFTVFHEAVEKTLGRPVYTHEFGLNHEGIRDEIFGKRPPPSTEEIMNLIPSDKRVVIVSGKRL